ncbi:MAG: hypothetical protein ACOCVZ_10260 [Gemmatimonadota bacterium]
MQAIWDVAPPLTWAILSVAALFLLAGFILLSHSIVRSKAYGDDWSGTVHPGRLEWTIRTGTGCLAVGAGLWAYELAAPVWVLAATGAVAAVAFGIEAAARVRAGGS